MSPLQKADQRTVNSCSPISNEPKKSKTSSQTNINKPHAYLTHPNHIAPTSHGIGHPIPSPKISSSLSSLSSGPMIPPGFENLIPNEAKLAHAQRRLRKIQKQKTKKPKNKSLSSPSKLLSPNEITSYSVINLANQLGLKIEGPIECIENLISEILKRQYADRNSSKA